MPKRIVSTLQTVMAMHAKAAMTASLALTMTLAASSAMAQDEKRFDWMPPESVSDSAQAGNYGEQIVPVIQELKLPLPTSDVSKFQAKKYEIDLAKFKIKNDGTDATATSKGINAALQYAKSIKATYITFPKGEYLIDPVNDPIILDLKNVIIDLNGSTLKAMPNGAPQFNMVQFVHGAETLRLTNGIIRGDRNEHDYTTIQSSHEWATGVNFNGGVNLEMDHLKIENFAGDGISSSTTGAIPGDRESMNARVIDYVSDKNLVSGNFNAKGAPIRDAERIRTIKPYDMTKANGEFEVGYTMGYQGFPHIKGRVYQAYFYDRNQRFVGMGKYLQFHKVQLPKNAMWMHLVFNQPGIEDVEELKTSVVRITNFTPSVKVHVHDNIIDNNRRLGFAMCGGQHWMIENNQFTYNGGTAPGYGIDFEDGWELVQHVVMKNNIFKDNRAGDLVMVSGSEIILDGNEFEKTVIIYGRAYNFVLRNNKFVGNKTIIITRTGVAQFYGNTYDGGDLSIQFDSKSVSGGIYRKPGETIATPPLLFKNETVINMRKITGTYLNFEDSVLDNVVFTVDEDTRLVRFVNNKADYAELVYVNKGGPVLYEVSGTKGTLEETGHGVVRRQPMPGTTLPAN